MGISSSSQSQNEGGHFTSIVNLNKKNQNQVVKIRPQASILKYVSADLLWENFLNGSIASFALNQSELASLLHSSIASDESNKSIGAEEIKTMVADYIEMVAQLSEKDTSKAIDFMAVCSSVLLLNPLSIELKVDTLFEWIVLGDDEHPDEFAYDQFLVAMSSFERGLSHAMGKVACSEDYVRNIASQWIALADPSQRGSADNSTRINEKVFLTFCTNRQHVVRRLLENLATAQINTDKIIELHEVVVETMNVLNAEPTAGDQWMANPAWKKTAERMKPKNLTTANVKPSSTLTLEWVHGYRGFDCRNNIDYADSSGTQILFTAAGLSIVQDNNGQSNPTLNSNASEEDKLAAKRTQSYFGEHADDIISITSQYFGSANENIGTLIATGEIGVKPSIYVYFWNPENREFQSLVKLEGYHKKGITQLKFGNRGKLLFSVGVDYTVAIYDTDYDPKTGKTGSMFGKMKLSSQGPKSQIMDCASFKHDMSRNYSSFLTCGEKHAIVWQTESNGTLSQQNLKLTGLRNKTFMCVVKLFKSEVQSDTALMCTADGSFVVVTGLEGQLLTFNSKVLPTPPHNKKCVNALSTNANGDRVASGGKDGTIILWHASKGSTGVLLTPMLQFTIFGFAESCSFASLVSVVKSSTKKESTVIPPVRSLCFSPDESKLLVGTQSCEILEFALNNNESFATTQLTHVEPGKTIFASSRVTGHYKHELWGLAVRPVTVQNQHSPAQYVTVGDDGYLRIWNVYTHQQILCLDLNGISRACCYSPDGNYIAVGFGGRVGRGKNKEDGIVRIFRVEYSKVAVGVPASLTQVAEMKEAKAWISVVKFSPDGTTLAVGSRDNNIYLYSVVQQYRRKGKFSKHNSGINQLDFTEDGQYLQSCCSAYEILFSSTKNGAQVTDGASKLSDAEWDTWTCTLGWPVIGIWSGSMDGSDINAVDVSPSKKLIATSDDFGNVNIFRYPAVQDGGSPCATYTGHSSHVTCARWISINPLPIKTVNGPKVVATDDYLISTGGEDKCIFQWRNSVQEGGGGIKGSVAAIDSMQKVGVNQVETLEFDAPTGGDEFMAIKPWLGAIVAPTAWSAPDPSRLDPFKAAIGELSNKFRAMEDDIRRTDKNDLEKMKNIYRKVSSVAELSLLKMHDSGINESSAPEFDELELAWVHGYRGYDFRNNVIYVETVEKRRLVLYYAASLGIMLDPVKQSQCYFRGHTDDIMSMAVFKNSPEVMASNGCAALVATGQQAKAKTFVWEVPSMKTLAVLSTGQKSVMMLCFSDDGRLLVSIAEDKSVAVSEWKSQTVLCNIAGEGNVTHQIAPGTNPSTNFNFVSCGDKHIRHWNLNGRNLTSSKIGTSSNKECSIQQYLCVVQTKGLFLVGCEDGAIYVITDYTKGVKSVFHHNVSSNTDDTTPAPTAATTKTGKGKKSAGGGVGGGGNKKSGGKKGPSVTSMYTNETANILVTGAKDGSVVVWDTTALALDGATKLSRADVRCYFNVSDFGISNLSAKQIQSLHMLNTGLDGNDELILVVATRGCDMLEVYCRTTADPSSPGAALLHSSSGKFNSMSRLLKGDAKLKQLCAPTDDGILNRSHCNDELWGVATHPFYPEYCTVGDDKTLRFYNIHTHKCLKVVPLGMMSRACAYHPTGDFVALGFGGRVGKGNEKGSGAIRLYSGKSSMDERSFEKIAECKDAKQWISDIKFTPDGGTLAAGAHDCKIYLYDVKVDSSTSASLHLRTKFVKHNSVINHFDFSHDGRYMQSNCSGYELLFSDANTGKQITSATEVKDVKWATWTCTLGWPVQGIWEKGMDGSDINSTSRSHSGHLIATSDDLGKVNLYRYPCISGGAMIPYQGHSSHVTKVEWSVADDYLISCGGNDKCIMQWKHIMTDMSGATMSTAGTSRKSTPEDDEDEDEVDDNASVSSSSSSVVSASDVMVDLMMSGPGGGDEAGAVKPWVGAIRAPKNPPPVSPNAPAAVLDLQWVFGYTSAAAGPGNSKISSNLFYNIDSNVVFPAAALGVLLSKNASKITDSMSGAQSLKTKSAFTQKFFQGHDDDILCLTISSDRKFIATGQTASKASKGKGSIIIWDAVHGRILSEMKNCHYRAVTSLAFSTDGTQLLSVGQDDNNTHTLWKDAGGGWSKVTQLSSVQSDKNTVFFTAWVHPNNPMATSNEYQFVSGGPKGINFWKLEGATLSKKSGRFGKKAKQVPLLCAANLQGKDRMRLVLGCSTGDLYSYDDREATIAVEKAHAGAVLCIAEGGSDCLFFVTGGKDNQIRVWNQGLQPISNFDLTSYSCVDASVASVDVKPSMKGEGFTVLVGTYGGEIIEVSTGSDETKDGKQKSDGHDSSESVLFDLSRAHASVLLYSHYKGELWGLATHPTDADIVATVGDDSTLRMWSIKNKAMLKCEKIGWPGRSIAWHPSGLLVAVGFHESVKGGYKKGSSSSKSKSKKSKATKDDDGDNSGGGHQGAIHLYAISIDTTKGDVYIRKVSDGCNSLAWIGELKFTPNAGSMLFAGSHDKKVYAYTLPGIDFTDAKNESNWDKAWSSCLDKPSYAFNKHSSAVLHVDFTADGRYWQSNCQASELLFGNVETGIQETSASKLADYNGQLEDEEPDRIWYSQTCKLGWAVQGIWPSGADMSDINSVDRHVDGKLLATADDFGLVKLFKFPCAKEASKFNQYEGHSSHVTNVRWTVSNHLASTGGNDKCLFIWQMSEK